MAYSAQIELYSLGDYGKISEKDNCRGAAKRYESTTDVDAWSLSSNKRSQYIQKIIQKRKAAESGDGDYLSEDDLRKLSREQLIQEIQVLKNEMQKRADDVKEAREFLQEKSEYEKKNQELQEGLAKVVYQQRLIEQEKEKNLKEQKEKIKQLEENIENFKGNVEELEKLKKEKDEKIKQLNQEIHKGQDTENEQSSGSRNLKGAKKVEMSERDKVEMQIRCEMLDQENCENRAIIQILEQELRDRDDFILSQNLNIEHLNGAKKELKNIERIVRKSQEKKEKLDGKGKGKKKADMKKTNKEGDESGEEFHDATGEGFNDETGEEFNDEVNDEENKIKKERKKRCHIEDDSQEKSRLSQDIENLVAKNDELANDSEFYSNSVNELKQLLEEARVEMERQGHENQDLRERIRKGKGLPEEEDDVDQHMRRLSQTKVDEIMNTFEATPLDAIRGLKSLLDEVKGDLRILKEENCELKGSLHELRKNYPSVCQELIQENERFEGEVKALKEQLANVGKLTDDLEKEAEKRVELEKEYENLMKNLESQKNEEIKRLNEQLDEERAKSSDLERKLSDMKNKLENMEALEIEREKMRKKLAKENEKYEKQLKEREEYVNDLQNSIRAMNEERECQQEKERCGREAESRQTSDDVCEMIRKLKASWESAYMDKLNKIKSYYEQKIANLNCQSGYSGGSSFRNTDPCPDRFSMLCEKVLTRGIQVLNLDELMFLHEEIYQAISRSCPSMNQNSDIIVDDFCLKSQASVVEIPIRLPRESPKKKIKKSCSSKKIQFASRSKTLLKKKSSTCGTCIQGEIISGKKSTKSFSIKSKF